MQICRYPENSNQTTNVFTFHLSKLGSAFAQLLSRSSIMTIIMAGILLEIGNKYNDEREKQFYLQGQNDIRHLQIILYLCT
jgi:hypothetical protein